MIYGDPARTAARRTRSTDTARALLASRPQAVPRLVAVVVLISACGSSAPAGTSTGRSGTNAATANAQKGVRFAECMRSHGVSAFPDPSASGSFTIDGIVNGSSLDPSAPAFEQAIGACKALEPAGFMGSPRSPQQAKAALEFARCIRTNGVPDFPDPATGQPLVDTNRIPSSATSGGLSMLNAAMRKCRDFAAAAGVGPR